MIGAITAGLFSTGTAASTNSYESIATVTVGAGGQSSVSFTGISGSYSHLQVRAIARDLRASTWIDTLWLYCNSDTTGSNYYQHQLVGGGSSASAAANVGVNNYGMPIGLTTATNVASAYAPNIIDILDYSKTTKYKTFRNLNGVEDNTNGSLRFVSGLWMSTAAITSLTFQGDSGNFAQYSSFALYGIKG